MKGMSLSGRIIMAFIIAATLILTTACISIISIKRLAFIAGTELDVNEIGAVVKYSTATIIMGAITGTVICILMGIMISRIIGHKLRMIRMALENIAEGKQPDGLLFAEEYLTNDETGMIIRALNKLAGKNLMNYQSEHESGILNGRQPH